MKALIGTLATLALGCKSGTPLHGNEKANQPKPGVQTPLSDAWWPKELFQQPINTDIVGITCFRGNPQRNYYGKGPMPKGNLQILWRRPVYGVPSGHWSGVGWTGQPLIVEWPEATKRWMNFYKQPGPKREIICGALDSQVHFIDAETGKESRKPLKMPYPYPIKGTVSVDPRGFPLLYVGCGIDIGAVPGYRVFSLLNYKELLVLPAKDKSAPRRWPGSDSNVLILKDHLFLPCENGIFYKAKLNAQWDSSTGKLSVRPQVQKFPMSKAGMESSMAVWDDFGYFADNGGTVRQVDLSDPRKTKSLIELGDDTDSTLVADSDGSLYVGIEKDKRTAPADKAAIIKFDSQTGKQIWKWSFEAGTIRGEHPVNGGVLSTGALWQKQPDGTGGTIFFTTSHHPRVGRGFLVALDTQTGHLRWKQPLRAFAWSSPIVMDGSVFCADSTGNAFLLDAITGRTLLVNARGEPVQSLELGANVESSPIVWDGKIYVGLRGGAVICIGQAPKGNR